MAKSTVFSLIALSVAVLVSSSIAFASEVPPTLNLDFAKLKTTKEVVTPPSLNISAKTFKKKTSKEMPPSIDISLVRDALENVETTKTVIETPPKLKISLPKKIKRGPTLKIPRTYAKNISISR